MDPFDGLFPQLSSKVFNISFFFYCTFITLLSQTRQAPTPTSHSALHLWNTDHTHLHLISTLITSTTKDTHTHSLTVRSRSHLDIPTCLPQGLPVIYFPVSSVSKSLLVFPVCVWVSPVICVVHPPSSSRISIYSTQRTVSFTLISPFTCQVTWYSPARLFTLLLSQ